MNRSYENTRYNNNTRGSGKHKKSTKKGLRKALIGSVAIFMLVGFSSKYSETDKIMTQEEGIEVTQVYSPSGGINTVSHGEKQHSSRDVLRRMIEEARGKVFSFEENHEDTEDINSSLGRG